MKTGTFPMEITKEGARSLRMNMANAELYLKEAIKQIITDPHEIVLFSVCIKSTIVVFKVAKQLSEENGGGPFC